MFASDNSSVFVIPRYTLGKFGRGNELLARPPHVVMFFSGSRPNLNPNGVENLATGDSPWRQFDENYTTPTGLNQNDL